MKLPDLIAACYAFDGSTEAFAEIIDGATNEQCVRCADVEMALNIELDTLLRWASGGLAPGSQTRRFEIAEAVRRLAEKELAKQPTAWGERDAFWLEGMLVLSKTAYRRCVEVADQGARRAAEDQALAGALMTKRSVMIVGPDLDDDEVTLVKLVEPPPICELRSDVKPAAARCDGRVFLEIGGRSRGFLPGFPSIACTSDGRLYSDEPSLTTCLACLAKR
ncbi:MAG: hypothetical protein ACHREM_25400 [Polyangiales bacterium]